MKNVLMIVLNSISRDARVLKEARSLVSNGYAVTIAGLEDENYKGNETIDGISIIRGNARDTLLSYMWPTYILLLVGFCAILYSVFSFNVFSKINVFSIVFLVLFFSIVIGLMFRLKKLFSGRRITKKLTPLGGYIHNVKRILAGYIRARTMLNIIIDVDCDIVHCHDLTGLEVGAKYKKKNQNSTLVYDSHEIFEEMSGNSGLLRRYLIFLQRKYSKHVDAFITVNDSIQIYLNNKYPKLPKGIVVKNATIKPKDELHYDGRLHKVARISQDKNILLYQGGFAQKRGLDKLVIAGTKLPENWVLVMMGWGNYEMYLKDIVSDIKGGDIKVKFIPPSPHKDLNFWTCGAEIGVIPYENTSLNHWYCSPNKLWEYPVANVPMLVSPFPEMKKIIKEYNVGWLLPSDFDGESIANIISNLSEEEIKEKKEACKEYIEKDNWEMYENRLLKLYNTL